MPEDQSRSICHIRSTQKETKPGRAVRIRTPPLAFVLSVGAGGAIGAALRHAFELAFPRDRGTFPLVTFAENITGSFLLGVVLIALLRAPRVADRWRPFLATGILGSFTTFSNVSVEIVSLVGMGASGTAAVYIGLGVAVGLSAVMLGIGLGASLMDRRQSPR